MRKAKCVDGHFFDLDRFSVCPLCGKPGTPLQSDPGRTPPTPDIQKTELLWQPTKEEAVCEPSLPEELPKTELLWRPEEKPFCGEDPTEEPAVEEPIVEEPIAEEPVAEEPAVEEPVAEEPAAEEPAAAELVAENSPESAVPVSPDRPEPEDESGLPVAWLVGISRPYRGCAFPCQAGRTRIGQSEAMDIPLPDAPSVSENLHAAVIYEPIKKEFFLQAGTENGLTYRNGNLVFSHDVLRSHDKIRLGAVEFVFLPLCGEHFSWDESTNRE